MKGDISVEVVWGDGPHRFRLPLGQLRELQDKCNAGPQEILGRLSGSTWRVDDVRETIRLGLIGGGMKPTEAYILTSRYVDDQPLLENVPVAQSVLLAALVGSEPLPEGKPTAEEKETVGSSSPLSTDRPRRSGSRRGKSTSGPSGS